MPDWNAATADLTDAEYATGFIPVRVPGTPDAFKEAPLSRIVSEDSTGQVGIGTTTPTRKLEVYGGHTDTVARLYSSGLNDDANDATLDLFASHPGLSFTGAGIGCNLNKHPTAGKRRSALAAGYIEFHDNGDFHVANAAPGGALSLKLRIAVAGHWLPGSDNAVGLGGAALRFAVVYAGTGTINTSDRRDKSRIGAIPDEWLDAWGEVEWARYKFRAATRSKGAEVARWHIGAVAQQVHEAFAARDLDAFAIGLCCFDEWDDDDAAGVKAGDRWGLRYDECFAIEAAWQRREMARLHARLAALEAAAGD